MAITDLVLPAAASKVAVDRISPDRNVQILKLAVGPEGQLVLLSVGAGDADDGTPRFTLAADDPAVEALAIIAASAASSGPAQIVGLSLRTSASFNRPANTTAYDVGDLVANSTTAGAVTPMAFTVAASAGGKGLIRSVKIDKAGAAATFRLHFFLANPTIANGDNSAFSTTKAGYLGYIEVVTAAFSDGAAGVGLGEVPFDLTSGTGVVGLLETRSGFTPTSGGAFAVEVTSWPEV